MQAGRAAPSFSRSSVSRRAARVGFREGLIVRVSHYLQQAGNLAFSTVLSASSAERAGRAHSADEAGITVRLGSDDRDALLALVLFDFDRDREH